MTLTLEDMAALAGQGTDSKPSIANKTPLSFTVIKFFDFNEAEVQPYVQKRLDEGASFSSDRNAYDVVVKSCLDFLTEKGKEYALANDMKITDMSEAVLTAAAVTLARRVLQNLINYYAENDNKTLSDALDSYSGYFARQTASYLIRTMLQLV